MSVYLILGYLPTSSASWNPRRKYALESSSACDSCGLVKPFHSKMLGETNSRTLSISRITLKCCNPQNISSMQLLLCSTLEYHTLLYQEVMPSLMTFLMKWCSSTSLLTFLRAGHAWNVCVRILLWLSEIHSNSYCFGILGPLHHS
jgi:hypothetical protein